MTSIIDDQTRAKVAELIAPASVDAMRARPGFSDVARNIARGWRLPDDEPDRSFALAMRDLGRFMACILALYLHHSGGLTLARLAALLDAADLAGPGRARAMLLYMQFIGYVTPSRSTADGRLRPYLPTPDLEVGLGNRMRRELAHAAPISPVSAELHARFDEPGVASLYYGMMGDIWIGYMLARKARLPGPSLEMFSERYAGMMMLAELLANADPEDVFPPRGSMRFTLAALARACDVSRTQVRKAFRLAEEAGFLILPSEGLALPTPMLSEHLELAIAGQIIGSEWVAERTLAKLAAPDAKIS